ncbi:DUF4179 domain-containing protein [Bacillus salacetis]|uniref:DUF4179 domain-containing protein n=1 Tax=Bacillus salacetis TaxID=2315464 RepID=UPI003B9DDFCE
MHNREEERLHNLNKKLEEAEFPAGKIDQAIREGIHKAHRSKKPDYLWKGILAAAVILLTVFISSIRVSEAFADYVSTFPGMDKIVEMVRQDKGLMSIIENDYVQEVKNSVTHQGIKITLHSLIADEEQLVLFYSVETERQFDNLQIERIRVKNAAGKEVPYTSLSFASLDTEEPNMYQSDYGLRKPLMGEEYSVVMEMRDDEGALAEEWNIPFEIDQRKVGKTKVKNINKEYLIEGQKIVVKQMEISPTRIGVEFHFPEENTKRIFDIEDLRLVDEKGETWSRISNGLVASGDFQEKTYYLQSNYFEEPKELDLVFNTIRALEKGKLEVQVDTDNLKILQAPDERLAKVEYEEAFDNGGALLFSWDQDYEQANHMNPINSYKNADGEEKELHSQYHEGAGSDMVPRFGFPYDRSENPGGMISFELQDYPSWIKGEVKIPVIIEK